MFCPRCRVEYKTGVSVCADCGSELVAEIEPVPVPEYVKFEEVLATFNPADIAIIKSILEGEDIDYYFHSEFFNQVDPLIQPARLMVRNDQIDAVREILKDIDIKYSISIKDNDSTNDG